MIGKTTKGADFGGLLRYIFEKEQSRYLDGNLASRSLLGMQHELERVAFENKQVIYPVLHVSLSPHPSVRLSDDQAAEFVRDFVERAGYGECQWVAGVHEDTSTPDGLKRPHIHVEINRVKVTDGKVVSAWRDWKRHESVLQELREEYSLTPVIDVRDAQRSAPTTGQVRRFRREQSEYNLCARDVPPERPVSDKIQDAIGEAIASSPDFTSFVQALEEVGVTVGAKVTRNGVVDGLSYEMDGVRFQAGKLGHAHKPTITGLQEHSVDFDLERDARTLALIAYSNKKNDSRPALKIEKLILANPANQSLKISRPQVATATSAIDEDLEKATLTPEVLPVDAFDFDAVSPVAAPTLQSESSAHSIKIEMADARIKWESSPVWQQRPQWERNMICAAFEEFMRTTVGEGSVKGTTFKDGRYTAYLIDSKSLYIFSESKPVTGYSSRRDDEASECSLTAEQKLEWMPPGEQLESSVEPATPVTEQASSVARAEDAHYIYIDNAFTKTPPEQPTLQRKLQEVRSRGQWGSILPDSTNSATPTQAPTPAQAPTPTPTTTPAPTTAPAIGQNHLPPQSEQEQSTPDYTEPDIDSTQQQSQGGADVGNGFTKRLQLPEDTQAVRAYLDKIYQQFASQIREQTDLRQIEDVDVGVALLGLQEGLGAADVRRILLRSPKGQYFKQSQRPLEEFSEYTKERVAIAQTYQQLKNDPSQQSRVDQVQPIVEEFFKTIGDYNQREGTHYTLKREGDTRSVIANDGRGEVLRLNGRWVERTSLTDEDVLMWQQALRRQRWQQYTQGLEDFHPIERDSIASRRALKSGLEEQAIRKMLQSESPYYQQLLSLGEEKADRYASQVLAAAKYKNKIQQQSVEQKTQQLTQYQKQKHSRGLEL